MQHFHVLTGAPGSGKSTILAALRSLGFRCVDEPAREILAEQRSFGGRGVPERDAGLFTDLMLSRSIFAYRRLRECAGPLFFDRGVPDMIAYATLLGVDAEPARSAARSYRYGGRVFVTPEWAEIYSQDEERRMTWNAARRFGEITRSAYEELGYELVELPRASPEERARFVLAAVGAGSTRDR